MRQDSVKQTTSASALFKEHLLSILKKIVSQSTAPISIVRLIVYIVSDIVVMFCGNKNFKILTLGSSKFAKGNLCKYQKLSALRFNHHTHF